MEQHPIPQQISSYQFKLVGDMTLKQFFQLATGVVISLIIYSLPIHPIIKWPIIFISTGLGAAIAFLPFEERPLERWILAFFRSIYSPTLFTWKKSIKKPIFYTESAPAPEINTAVVAGPVVEANTAKLEEAEKSYLSKISGLWSITSQTPATGANTVTNTPINAPQISPVNFKQNTPVAPPTPVPNDVKPATVQVSVPQQLPTIITRSAPKLIVEESKPLIKNEEQDNTTIEGQKVENQEITTNAVEFSVDAAPPSPPIAINTIVGQVMDQERKIVEGAILEIKDSMGRPVRALKSNKAGHFIIVTPLANGKYQVTVEKEGFTFEPVSFEAKGDMIPAIAIRGNRTI